MLCKIQSHCKDNTFPIPDWTWIVAKLELDWTWIETTTTLHQRRNGRNTCYYIELFHNHKNKKKFFSRFSCHLQHLLIIKELSGDRYFFFLSPSCHQRIFNINIRCKFWWQVGDRCGNTCHHLTNWYSASVAGDRKIAKKTFFSKFVEFTLG